MMRFRSFLVLGSLLGAALFGFAGAAGAQYDGDTGALSLSPSSAVAGATINASGTCYASGAEVSLTVDGAAVGTTTAGDDGDIAASITVPTSASGTVPVAASGLTDDGTTCVLSANLTVTPAGSPAPAPTPAPQPTSSAPTLPVTGTEITPGLVASALALLGVGAGMVFVARRRHADTA